MPETVETLVIGGGQAGIAMSEHLGRRRIEHLVLERGRIAERWRSARWDSLVMNGPAWHDRFPGLEFDGFDPDSFPGKEAVADYFERYAAHIGAPIRSGVTVTKLSHAGQGFLAETTEGPVTARQVVVATGPFQRPLIPPLVPADAPVTQLHSNQYRHPGQLPDGGVLVVGAGSSGSQIADELLRAGRPVYLSVGPHNRPPRRYRGKDFVWWLGVLGKWGLKTPRPGTEHVTIAVSGARGGHTVDFRRMAMRGVTLLGRAEAYDAGVLRFAPDLADNIARGDADYLSVLDEADAYADRHGLDLPADPEARAMAPDPACVREPVLSLHLRAAGIGTILWATGYGFDFGWLDLDVLDAGGRPRHQDGVSVVPGLYFLGLPWLTSRSSSFIWGVWRDAELIAGHVAARTGALAS